MNPRSLSGCLIVRLNNVLKGRRPIQRIRVGINI